MKTHLITSESVTEGHPDKLCDQVSDAILDAYLATDPDARVACETTATAGLILITGEVTANTTVDVQQIARETVRRIGYTAEHGFDPDSIAVVASLRRQSPDIARGVDRANDIGAGDQGMMFGYSTDETDAYMPTPIYLSHRLTRQLAEVRKQGILPWLGPDGKSQVTVEYRDGRPLRIDTVVISTQHSASTPVEFIRDDILREVCAPVLPRQLVDERTRYLVNPTGRFVLGGPCADAGLTGRKIIVDTYGGMARHGGGAFSGKDPTKVDRSAAYAARYVAKNLVAAGFASRLELQVAYAIGTAEPVSLSVDTFGTGKLPDSDILAVVRRHFDLRPAAIIHTLDLRRPIYSPTAVYGHFGRDDLDLPWERLDKVDVLKTELEVRSANER